MAKTTTNVQKVIDTESKISNSKKMCEHGRKHYFCKECKGPGICVHGNYRHICVACGGSSLCQHQFAVNAMDQRCVSIRNKNHIVTIAMAVLFASTTVTEQDARIVKAMPFVRTISIFIGAKYVMDHIYANRLGVKHTKIQILKSTKDIAWHVL